MNKTRKITTETWVREFTDPASDIVMGQATFYPERVELYPPHMILKEQDMLELVDFLLECLEYLHPDIPYKERQRDVITSNYDAFVLRKEIQ